MPDYKHISQAEIDKIELRSDEVQEILSYVPHWIIRSGIGVLCGFFVLMGCLSYMVKYPDTVRGNIMLTTEIQAEKVFSPSPAGKKIIHWAVKDSQWVRQDTLLAILYSNADWEKVMALRKRIDPLLEADVAQFVDTVRLPNMNQLGEIQTAYNSLKNSCTAYQELKSKNLSARNVAAIDVEIEQQENKRQAVLQKISQEKELLRQSKQKLSNKKALLADGIIVVKEVEAVELEVQNYERQLANYEVELKQIDVNIATADARITQVSTSQDERKSELERNIRTHLGSVAQALRSWETNNLIKAPISGRVDLPERLQTQPYIESGKEILTILPSDSSKIIGTMEFDGRDYGKLAENQPVYIQLHAYHHYEYGLVKGYLAKIAPLPRNGAYQLTVEFSDSLLQYQNGTPMFSTTYQKPVAFKPEMMGFAEIITKDLRFSERIFYRLKAFMKDAQQ